MEAKLALSMLEEDSQLNFYCIGQNLHVYEQELFCIAVSYLQFIEWQNSTKTVEVWN